MAYSSPASTTPRSGQVANSGAGIYQAHLMLHLGFIMLPLAAGIDKFTRAFTDWDKYLAPTVAETVGVSTRTFMMGVGVVEILAAIVVALTPRFGGYLIAAWLLGIIMNLGMHPIPYWDVALRDFGLMLAALALARLSKSLKQRN